jgi:hypothetical protein
MTSQEWAGWVPMRLAADPSTGSATVTWCHLGEARFVEPFAQQTIHARLRAADAEPVRTTSVDDVLERAATLHGPELSGLIFHISRCGSTLVTQMLAAVSRHTVLSEPVVVDDIVRAAALAGAPEELRVAWLRAGVAVLGAMAPADGNVFIKAEPWHVFDLPLFRRAFPSVPWIFLYRDPTEVIVSQQRNPGLHMLPGAMDPGRLGLSLQEAVSMSQAEYRGRVLGAIVETALAGLDDDARLVDYRQLPGAIDEVLAHFDTTLSDSEYEAVVAAGRFDAKHPGVVFEPDSKARRAAAGEDIRQSSAHLAPLFEELERRRRLQRVLAQRP